MIIEANKTNGTHEENTHVEAGMEERKGIETNLNWKKIQRLIITLASFR